jgi:hypothetical protein
LKKKKKMAVFGTTAALFVPSQPVIFEWATTASIEKQVDKDFKTRKNEAYIAYYRDGHGRAGCVFNQHAADALLALRLFDYDTGHRLQVYDNVILMRPDNKPFTEKQILEITKAFDWARCFDCAAAGCFDGTVPADAYCARMGCRSIICSKCVAQNETICKKKH